MKELLLIISLDGFQKFDTEDWKINGLTLSDKNLNEYLTDYFDTAKLWALSGITFEHSVVNRPYFITILGIESVDDIHQCCEELLIQVESLLDMLWFVKDTRASSIELFGLSKHFNKTCQVRSYGKRSYSDGTFRNIGFTHEEFSAVGKFIASYNDIKLDKKTTVKVTNLDEKSGLFTTYANTHYSELNRIERAYGFLLDARLNNNLLKKISYYVLTLECLFSTDKAEVTHKLSERVAFYSEETTKKRKETFKFIKDCYDLRSSYVHGGTIKKENTNEKLENISMRLDQIVRNVFSKIILIDSAVFLNDNKMHALFQDLIFGSEASSDSPTPSSQTQP